MSQESMINRFKKAMIRFEKTKTVKSKEITKLQKNLDNAIKETKKQIKEETASGILPLDACIISHKYEKALTELSHLSIKETKKAEAKTNLRNFTMNQLAYLAVEINRNSKTKIQTNKLLELIASLNIAIKTNNWTIDEIQLEIEMTRLEEIWNSNTEK